MIEPIENTQIAIEKIAYHLGFQNKQSVDTNEPEFCLYRNNSGLKCAIGSLIPDGLYDSMFERTGSFYSLIKIESIEKLFQHCDPDVLIVFQKLHDLNFPENWRDEIIKTIDYLKTNEIFYLNKEKILEEYDKGVNDRENKIKERMGALDRLAQLSQEYGGYDEIPQDD